MGMICIAAARENLVSWVLSNIYWLVPQMNCILPQRCDCVTVWSSIRRYVSPSACERTGISPNPETSHFGPKGRHLVSTLFRFYPLYPPQISGADF